jgi:CheY-like chemotaxis protein
MMLPPRDEAREARFRAPRYDGFVILLVEDDEDVCDMLSFALRNRGFKVQAVHNGHAALAMIERQRPCLVILDLVMPGMSGQQVIAELHARDLADLPVCVISALSDASPQGAVAVLSKPFDVSSVVELANRYCAHTETGTAAR